MRIKKIEPIQYEGDVYNLHIKDNHNYFANGNCVSNCHRYSAEECTNIMTKLRNARHRFGTTGTLHECNTNSMILEGLFGKVYQTITTRELIDNKHAAELNISLLKLRYPEEDCLAMRKAEYQTEMAYLFAHQGRNRFIRNLALSLKGNTLILFERIGKHGDILQDAISKKLTAGRKLFYIHGQTDEDSNEVRRIVETETDSIILASYGVYQEGISIRNLHNIIFASPSKSKVRVLQSIGRGLRLSATKWKVKLFDLYDDLTSSNRNGNDPWTNYSMRHAVERIAFYIKEKHEYRQYKIRLEDGARLTAKL